MSRLIVRLVLLLLLCATFGSALAAQQGVPRTKNRIRSSRDTVTAAGVSRPGKKEAPTGTRTGRRPVVGADSGGVSGPRMAKQCGLTEDNPCVPIAGISVSNIGELPAGQVSQVFYGQISNGNFNVEYSTVTSVSCDSPAIGCQWISIPPGLYGGGSEEFAFKIQTIGVGTYPITFSVTLSANGASSTASVTKTVQVTGTPIFEFLNPAGGSGTVAYQGTLRAQINPAGEIIPGHRSWVDGVERTSSMVVNGYQLSLATASLGLARGTHTWKVHACIDGRCDDVEASFFYDAPLPPQSPPSQTALNTTPFPKEDLSPPNQSVVVEDSWLIGALPRPPIGLRGCAEVAGNPEIRLLDPVSYQMQFGSGVYPSGLIFRAEEVTSSPLTFSTVTFDRDSSASAPTCASGSAYLTDADYQFNPGECAADDLRWGGYPYGDRAGGLCYVAPGGSRGYGAAPAPHGGASAVTRSWLWRRLIESLRSEASPPTGLAPVPTALSAWPAAGKIDPSSYQVMLNDRPIYPVDDYTTEAALHLIVSATTLNGNFTLPEGHPGLNVNGWNELVVSVADSTQHRTAIRSRFLYRPAPPNVAVTTRRLDRVLTRRSMGDCAAFGPVQCDELYLTQTVPGFVSRDKDRSLHLVYRSGSQRQRLILPVYLQYPAGKPRPDSMYTFAKVGGVQTGPTLRFAGTKGAIGGAGAWPLAPSVLEDRVVGAELDAIPTGGLALRQVSVTVREFNAGGFVDRVLPGDVVQIHLTDTLSTRFGPGWQLAEFTQLLPGLLGTDSVRVWALGDGSFYTFKKVGSAWVAPGGMSAKLWVVPADPVPFRIAPADGSVMAYYPDGRPAWNQDQMGNRITFGYTGSRLTSIADPNGSTYQFTYDDPSGAGRVSLIQIVASGVTRNVMRLRYGGSGRLIESIIYRTATAGDTTKYGYTASGTSAYLTSVVAPSRVTTPMAVTDFGYDTLAWIPVKFTRPELRGVRDISYYRSALSLAVPQSVHGRLAGADLYAPVRREYYRLGSMDVMGRVTEAKADSFGHPVWVRTRAPLGSQLQADGSFAANQSDITRTITRDGFGRPTKILGPLSPAGQRQEIRYHYSTAFQMVDTIWRTSRGSANPYGLDMETFTYDSVSLGTVGGLGAGSDGRCYRMLSSKDALGTVASSVQYVSTGRWQCLPWKVTGYGATSVTTFTYPAGGSRPITATDPLGLVTTATYDPVTGNTASVATLATGVASLTYDPFGSPISSTAGDGTVTMIARDYSGRDTASRTGLGPVTKKVYGRDGAVDNVSIYASVVAEGSMVTVGSPQVTRWVYNVFGLVDSVIGPGTAPRVQRTRYTKDLQPDTSWTGNGGFVASLYDWAGRPMTSIQSAISVTTAFATDSVNTAYGFTAGVQAGKHLSPGQRNETWYDARGMVSRVRTLDARIGRVSEHRYGYTPSGALRVDSLVLADNVFLIRSFQYDALGRRIVSGDTLRKSTGTGTISGDTAGKQVYTYNATSQLLESVTGYGAGSATPFGAATWTYDIGGREIFRSVQLNGGANRLNTRTGYTSAGHVDSIRTSWDLGATVGPQWYRFKQEGYDLSGDLLAYTEQVNTGASNESVAMELEYSNDGMRRLVESRRTVGGSWSEYDWTYDAFNNRTSQLSTSSAGGGCTAADTSRFGSDNRLLSTRPVITTASCPALHLFAYDNAGNRVLGLDSLPGGGSPAWARSVMTYTATGQLYFSATPAIFPTYEMTWNWYDASGLRAMSKEGNQNGVYPLPDTTIVGPWTYYIYDGGQLALTASRAGNNWSIGRRQLSGGIDQPLVLRTGAGPVALLTDRQGTFQTAITTAGTWDQTFAVTASNLFGARDGATRGNGSASANTGFAGASNGSSGTGFVYLRNRWYDPNTGRFLTQDPIGLAGGINLYAYAGNNPVAYSDPWGLDCKDKQGNRVPCNPLGGGKTPRLARLENSESTRGSGFVIRTRSDGTTYQHQGNDLEATEGTRVNAMYDGVVSSVTPYEDGDMAGIRVTITSSNLGTPGETSSYYHLSKVKVSVGDVVEGGDKIGVSGITGNADPAESGRRPHLHVRKRVNGVDVNPGFD